MLRHTIAFTLLTAAATAAPAQMQERSSAPACSGEACTSSASLSFSAMHRPGGAHAPASSMEVASWSFGASQPGSSRRTATGLGMGKASVSDLSMTRAPACSAASGACPGTITVQLAASRKGWDGCVKGSHIASAQLRGTASAIQLTDVTIEDCDSANGRMKLGYASIREVSASPPAR
jgi:hypothetical protein